MNMKVIYLLFLFKNMKNIYCYLLTNNFILKKNDYNKTGYTSSEQ